MALEEALGVLGAAFRPAVEIGVILGEFRTFREKKSFDTGLIADSFMKYLSYFLFISKFSPHYTENTLYARKWMVRLLLRLVSRTDDGSIR